MEIILGSIMSVISGIVANFAFSMMNKKNYLDLKFKPKEQFTNVQYPNDEGYLDTIRANNRKIFNEKQADFIFYMITYIAIVMSFYIPLNLHNGIMGGNLDLSTTKLATKYVLEKNHFLVISLVFSFIVYMPVLFISSKIAKLVSRYLTHYFEITKYLYNSIRIPFIVFFAFFNSANVYWIINVDILWTDIIRFTFAAFLLLLLGALNP